MGTGRAGCRGRCGARLASAAARAASPPSECLSGWHSSARFLYAALISNVEAIEGTPGGEETGRGRQQRADGVVRAER